MMRLATGLCICAIAVGSTVQAQPFFSMKDLVQSGMRSSQRLAIHDLQVQIPESWQVRQSALDNGVSILRLSNGLEHLHFFSKEGHINAREIFVNGSEVLEHERDLDSSLPWTTLTTRKGNAFVSAFVGEFNGRSYYGYASADSSAAAKSAASSFLKGVTGLSVDSLTSPDYTGKKYYLGFGAAMSFDPKMMHNEVKYDVMHTHDIFTKDVGGNYIGTQFLSYKDATKSNITGKWDELKRTMTSNDMYVQYSSGHGSKTGLAVGVNYNQIRDTTLAFNAKETIIFTMACHSGGLVEAFDAKKSEWSNYQQTGRTLFVMSSSSKAQTSSTGPGTDPEEPAGQSGTAGSAFGHALWKALIGYGDGYVDGVKDGYLSLDEIQKFTSYKTNAVGGHKPVFTGSYDPKLIMNRVPPKAFIDALERSTEGLSDEEVMSLVQDFDASQRVN